MTAILPALARTQAKNFSASAVAADRGLLVDRIPGAGGRIVNKI